MYKVVLICDTKEIVEVMRHMHTALRIPFNSRFSGYPTVYS